MPLAGVQASALDQANLTETGAGIPGLTIGHQSVSSLCPQLGTRVARDVDLGEARSAESASPGSRPVVDGAAAIRLGSPA